MKRSRFSLDGLLEGGLDVGGGALEARGVRGEFGGGAGEAVGECLERGLERFLGGKEGGHARLEGEPVVVVVVASGRHVAFVSIMM